MIDAEEFGAAYEFASKRSRGGARWTHLRAFAAHMNGLHEESAPLYKADELGFGGFWSRYNCVQALLAPGAKRRGPPTRAVLWMDPENGGRKNCWPASGARRRPAACAGDTI